MANLVELVQIQVDAQIDDKIILNSIHNSFEKTHLAPLPPKSKRPLSIKHTCFKYRKRTALFFCVFIADSQIIKIHLTTSRQSFMQTSEHRIGFVFLSYFLTYLHINFMNHKCSKICSRVPNLLLYFLEIRNRCIVEEFIFDNKKSFLFL